MFTAYLFELRQIQPFVFGTGKLRDASGASELIDSISFDSDDTTAEGAASISGLAGALLSGVGDVTVYRAAGGVIDIVGSDRVQLTAFRAAFRLALARHAPGLVYADSLATGATAAEARDKARRAASDGGPLKGVAAPPGSPMIRPAPRSGGSPAAMSDWTSGGRCAITQEFADLPTLAKRQFLKGNRQTLAEKFVPADQRGETWRWPTVFATDEDGGKDQVPFPFLDGVLPRIAVLHADGNGMGKLFARAVAQFKDDMSKVRQLSQDLTRATQAAVQGAMRAVLAAHADFIPPARPILLGGDDVTLILRADLVSDFTTRFATQYQDLATEAVIRHGITTNARSTKPWGKMTTKIGFVVIGPNQPFARAYDLAASLAVAARDPSVSRIAFHRVAGAEIAEDAQVLEAQGNTAAPGITLWKADLDLDSFARLRDLARLLDDDDIGRGPLRQVPALLKADPAEARRVYARALEVIKARNKETAARLEIVLKDLGFDGSWTARDGAAQVWCPLLAAHDLAHVDRRPG